MSTIDCDSVWHGAKCRGFNTWQRKIQSGIWKLVKKCFCLKAQERINLKMLY